MKIIQVKFGLHQLLSMELEMFLPSTSFGHVVLQSRDQ